MKLGSQWPGRMSRSSATFWRTCGPKNGHPFFCRICTELSLPLSHTDDPFYCLLGSEEAWEEAHGCQDHAVQLYKEFVDQYHTETPTYETLRVMYGYSVLNES